MTESTTSAATAATPDDAQKWETASAKSAGPDSECDDGGATSNKDTANSQPEHDGGEIHADEVSRRLAACHTAEELDRTRAELSGKQVIPSTDFLQRQNTVSVGQNTPEDKDTEGGDGKQSDCESGGELGQTTEPAEEGHHTLSEGLLPDDHKITSVDEESGHVNQW